ncbi:LON peptidase N-terminal domain and RING finger protein 1 isoform X1 [Iris pallida]|uniref:LON peptidase N-terminal domain and RING finger protein 1 isoform X1 n=1 Tax=Iris pallida TaxID=29817 RepID=A0AAX6GHL6_IRIPA|nr:LON peptidase N-terminal domain and RING finger protein 1 isoform X1 [Iris pallida]KAJ6833030.1 LON peptidase N-terminal domain and RING finger protein 1 isoform X1 [Iris pallida]
MLAPMADDDGIEEFDQEISTEVFDLVKRGNRAFREGRFEEAISFYSKAQLLKPGDPVILSNRSVTFCRISQFLKERSASDSEHHALNGLDPTTHAELAVKDSEKVLKVRSNSPKSYLLKANALILLERYEDAKAALISGLLVDPLSHLLQNSLRQLEQITFDSRNRVRKLQRSDDIECTLCLKLLYEPVTTPCGHSFCRSCLLQSMDHGNKCPICRTVLFISPRTYPISVTLNNIIQRSFPEEYAERKSEHESLTHLGVDLMPLFVMDVVLPCQKLSLNIFEPRYRLMVRRIMEGNHRMGMVIIDSATGSVADVACEVEIVECEPLPDGRFYLEVIGRRRFRILQSWDQDGYRVAQVEWIEDIHPPEGSQERDDLTELASGAAELARSCLRSAREAARTGRRSRHMELQEEGMPGPQDPEKFSFWLVNQLNLRPTQRLELLRLRDTRERITRSLIFLRAGEQGCRVQ